jgi:DNA-binding transcriptional LysR family regulator
MHSGVLSDALRTLRKDRPAVHVALYNLPSAEQLEGLRQRSLDVALVCEPPLEDDPDLDRAQLLNDPMLLALPDSHRLARTSKLTPAALGKLDWIAVQHKESMLKHDNFVAACARAGFTPNISMQAPEPLTALGLVAAGLGVAMIQSSLRHQAPAGVVLREVPWFTYRTPLWAAWHRINLRPLVEIFRLTLVGNVRTKR